MYCIHCGKEIEEGSEFCAYCGANQKENVNAAETVSQKTEQETVPSEKKGYNTLAIVGFAIALISLFLNFAGIMGIAAVIVSVIGYKKTAENGENGQKLALAGIIIGAISVLYGFWVLL